VDAVNHRGSVPEQKAAGTAVAGLALTAAEDRWLAYLHSLAARQLTSADVASNAEQLWLTLVERAAAATPPDASPTNDGGLLMSWAREGRHLEIEVLPDLTYEWFYRERLADMTENDDAASVDVVSPELIKRLRQVLA
jgi:hypothetical protein